MKKILFVCMGNSCRSQMAEAYLKSLDKELLVHSAGIEPEKEISSFTVQAMKDISIDISNSKTTAIHEYVDNSYHFLITLSETARQKLPSFKGGIEQRLHISITDPFEYSGSDEHKQTIYNDTRDDIMNYVDKFYKLYIKGDLR